MAVDQICHLLVNTKGIVRDNLDGYVETIRNQNINGKVLMNCGFTDLKETLNMKFGDWELFKIVLIQLRNINTDQGKLSPMIHPGYENGNINNIKQNNSELEQLVLEKEAVFGLVSNINEDARDDIEMQEDVDKDKTTKAAHIYLSVVGDEDGLIGRGKSRSIPKLVVSEESADYHRSFEHLTTSVKSLRRQRSKSENPPEFDEKDEQEFNSTINKNRFVVQKH